MLNGRHMNYLLIAVLTCNAGSAFARSQNNLSDLEGLERSEDRANSPSQVVILNNSPNTEQEQKQNQETGAYQETYSSSRTDVAARQGWGNGDSLNDLRKVRNNKEAQNEQILMEKLEESRMHDEKSRLKRLFKIRQYNKRRHQEMGDMSYFDDDDDHHGRHDDDDDYHHYPKKKKVVKVVQIDNGHRKHEAPDHDKVRRHHKNESQYSYNNWSDIVDTIYFKGQLGLGEYSAAENAVGVASWGLSLGKNVNNRLHYEVGVFRTNYEVDDPRGNYEQDNYGNVYTERSNLRDLSQYNFNALLGYKLITTQDFSAAFRAGLSYARRESESSNIPGFAEFKSNAVDGLLGVSTDVRLGESFYATGSFDYFTNVLNDISSTNSQLVERVETSDYYVLGVGLKYQF